MLEVVVCARMAETASDLEARGRMLEAVACACMRGCNCERS